MVSKTKKPFNKVHFWFPCKCQTVLATSNYCTGGVCTLFCNVQYLLSFNPHDCSILFVQIKYCKYKPCVGHTAVMDRYSKLIAAKEISFFKQIGAKSYFEFHICVGFAIIFWGKHSICQKLEINAVF